MGVEAGLGPSLPPHEGGRKLQPFCLRTRLLSQGWSWGEAREAPRVRQLRMYLLRYGSWGSCLPHLCPKSALGQYRDPGLKDTASEVSLPLGSNPSSTTSQLYHLG